jgi:hypothetical protein
MSQYPEKIPNSKPMDRFTFSLAAANSVKSQLQNELDSIENRIDRIVNQVLLDGVPIIRLVLQTSRDRKDLKKFAKAMDRIADLVERQDSLTEKLETINLAQKDPSWFALTFGDFSQDIENDLNSIFNSED